MSCIEGNGMRKVVFLVLTLLSLSGCGVTLEGGIERTPAATAAATATSTPASDRLQPTLEALRTENQRLVAALTAQPVPATATPPPPDLGRNRRPRDPATRRRGRRAAHCL